MKQFKDPKIVSIIEKKFGFDEEFALKWVNEFNVFFPEKLSSEYLSHVRSALETYGREKLANDYFRINIYPEYIDTKNKCVGFFKPVMSDTDALKFIDITYSQSNVPEYQFDVNEIRIILAHELAHAYFAIKLKVMLKTNESNFTENDISFMEVAENHISLDNLSSLFGSIIMHDRNNFYKNQGSGNTNKEFTYKDLEEIINMMYTRKKD